jgi:hypothetical protein
VNKTKNKSSKEARARVATGLSNNGPAQAIIEVASCSQKERNKMNILLKILSLPLIPFAALLAKGMDGQDCSYWFCLKETFKQWWE